MADHSHYPVTSVPVSELTFGAALDELLAAPALRRRMSVHFATTHTLVAAADDDVLRGALERADIVAPDGMPLVWVGRLRGRRVERVCGPDLMPALIDRSRAIGARHYLYGGAPGVNERLGDQLKTQFPGADIVGTHAPPFRPLTALEDEADVARINAARPDYVWVGLGSPKQDLWIAEHRDRLDAAVLLAVGAAFDFHSGSLRRAPRWMQGAGLEWLYRLLSEPRRLIWRYTVTNARFIWLLGRELAHESVARSRAG